MNGFKTIQFLLAGFCLSFFQSTFAELSCEKTATFRESELQTCRSNNTSEDKIQNKLFYAISLKAKDFKSVSYDHGYLMAEMIEQGSLVEALNNLEKVKKTLTPVAKSAMEGALNCVMKKLEKGLSQEFLDGVQGLYEGYKAKLGDKAKYTEKEFKLANFSIEVGNILYGLVHQSKVRVIPAVLSTFWTCGGHITKKVVGELKDMLIDKGGLKEKFACTGIITPSNTEREERFIHGRNLEQTSMMNTWNKYPTFFLMKEGDKQGFTGFGTAGLIFSGGISGMNESGLTVSLHQLNTMNTDYKLKKHTADMAPFLQQRVLRDATNIDEALKIIKKTEHISAWIILIGDSKTNESASIELHPKGAVIARSAKNAPLAQSNHYVHEAFFKKHFQSRYSNYFESTMRLTTANKLANDPTTHKDVSWLINSLGNHYDGYDNKDRLFGRSVARPSNIMSSIVDPEVGQIWMTIGDRPHSLQSTYAGFQIDFKNTKLSLLENPEKTITSLDSNYMKATDTYVLGYLLNANGNPDGAYEKVVAVSQMIDDPLLWYIKAKFELKKKEYKKSLTSWEHVLEDNSIDAFLRARAIIYSEIAKHFLAEAGEKPIQELNLEAIGEAE